MTDPVSWPLGASLGPRRTTRFLVWAPAASSVDLLLDGRESTPLEALDRGYHAVEVDEALAGVTYRYRLRRDDDVIDRPDPASRFQPDGVHGPSAVDAADFPWSDLGWSAPPLREQSLYELHVGTFTEEGTFAAVIPRLDALVDLGITTLLLMPVAQYPGERNWGYDGVLPYAVQHSYGGPAGLRQLVDAAHAHGLAVHLDVVYNHFGPEGDVVDDFAPYLTDRYGTPWGAALNVDGPGSDEVRRYVVENAVRWVRDFHVDGLRLDAVHAIFDTSATHLLAEIADAVHAEAAAQGRNVVVVAESDLNDPRLVRGRDGGGYGLDGQWADDFHHAVHVTVTGEDDGYYADYDGLADVARAIRHRFVYTGQHAPSRQRRHGAPADDVPHDRFVVCVQNHDQVGNRMLGERLGDLVSFEQEKLAVGLLLTSPFVPLLFMGQEYGELAPFQYFTSHTEPELIEAVRTGRRQEFASFAWEGEAPDPQAEATFVRSQLEWDRREHAEHRDLLQWHRLLLAARRGTPALGAAHRGDQVDASVVADGVLRLDRSCGDRRSSTSRALVLANVRSEPVSIDLPCPAGRWRTLLDSAAAEVGGPGGGPPAATISDGTLSLLLAGHSLVVLTPDRDNSTQDQG